MTRCLLAIIVLVLSGCAGTGLPGLGSLPNLNLKTTDKLVADLNAAIAQAEAAKDPMAPQRVICYRTILSLIPELPAIDLQPIAKPSGVFGAFEASAELVEAAAGVTGFTVAPDARVRLAVDCGPLQVRARGIFARFLLRFRP